MGAALQSPGKLLALVSRAQTKAGSAAGKALNELLEPLKISYRLVTAYATGAYRDISIENIGLLIAAIFYFVMPIDSLPDFILGLGLTDDAAILAWTFTRLKDELEKFKLWEDSQAD